MKRLNAAWLALLIVTLVVTSCTGGKAPEPTPAPTAVSAAPTATTVPTKELMPTAAPTQPTAPTAVPATVAPTAAPTQAAQTPSDTLYLSIVWHQHQPLYYKDPQTNVYTRPWVRVHATKDYYDMAAMLKNYPDVHVTFNLTPVLIRQLDDFAAGAKDVYQTTAEKPAAQLTADDRRFILTRFFDTNTKIIARFPRYKELSDKRGGAEAEKIDAAMTSFTEADFRDLQVLFNLAWFDPDFLAQAPLKALVDKGRNFAEEDKKVVFDKALDVIKNVIPVHKELQDKGQIEVITTPYAHPILPLLYDTNLAKVGNPDAIMPPNRFSYPNDAIAQVQKSVEVYKAHYGRAPVGMWPGEGAVAQQIVKMVSDAGYQWMASGEIVLAKSLGMDSFTRNSADTVQEADALYRPYVVTDPSGAKVTMVFRDLTISDKIGFTYSGTPGPAAADDFMQRLENIRARLKEQNATGPHLVSIILDGENAWENYDNDGKDFLNALYQRLSTSKTVKTVTPSEYLKLFPDQKTLGKDLFPGAWFSANYDTWIGEAEEAQGWNYLYKTRQALAEYDIAKRKTTTPENLARAQDFMYLAEGSDWFWWFGTDQDSGDDGYFDYDFRSLLGEVYKSLGEPVPDFVQAPIVAAKVAAPSRQMSGLVSPTVDGKETTADEWAKAGLYQAVGGSMARAEDVMTGFYYGLDAKNAYIRADAKADWSTVKDGTLGIYVKIPRAPGAAAFSRASAGAATKTVLGFSATHLAEVNLADKKTTLYTATGLPWAGVQTSTPVTVAIQGKTLEMAIPLSLMGDLQPGDDVRLAAVVTSGGRDLQMVPASGPAQIVVPDLGTTKVVVTVDDPQGDDKGPGTYTYPTDSAFKAGDYDLKQFTAGYDDKNVVFKFTFYGRVPNPWGSGNNLAIQTLDVYVDKDPGKGTGVRLLMPGRNAALEKGNGWDLAVWAEGWTPGVYKPDAKGVPQKTSDDLKIIVDPAASTVTLRVPRAAFGDGFDPAKAGYAAVVLGQDGFPDPGVWRVRNVNAAAEQWRFGGAPTDTNHTRIIDVAWPADAKPAQFDFLGKYTASQEKNMDKLGPDDFAQVPELVAK